MTEYAHELVLYKAVLLSLETTDLFSRKKETTGHFHGNFRLKKVYRENHHEIYLAQAWISLLVQACLFYWHGHTEALTYLTTLKLPNIPASRDQFK